MSLEKLRKQREEARKNLKRIFDEASSKTGDGSKSYDFQVVTCLKDDIGDVTGTEKSVKVAARVQAINSDLDEVCQQIETLEAAEKAANAFDDRANQIDRPPLADGSKSEQKTVGQLLTSNDVFKSWQAGAKTGQIHIPGVSIDGLKTLMQTSAGWLPESTRTGQLVDAVTRPLQVLDIMPIGQTGQANVVYMQETTRTHAAAERNEGAAAAESTFVLAEQSSPVREIADSIPVTDIQLEDVAMVESYLDGRLRFGIQQRLDTQILAGDGVAPNIDGILNTTGIQTQARGIDPIPDAIYRAMTLIRVNGRAVPTHVLLHPTDWQQIRLLRTQDGIYIWGSPSESGPERIWGLPVVQNEALTVNTGLVGSFEPAWISLFERRGLTIERGYINAQFTQGQQTLRGSMRAALTVFRPPAFATVTGI